MKTLRIACPVGRGSRSLSCLCAGSANNQPAGTVGGVVGGAAVGAVVGGPVGAVVGAVVGAIVGSSLPAQPSVVYSGPVVVGQPLLQTITVYPAPQYRQYQYAIINNQRVIIDVRTRRIVRIVG